jgi:hypothetical protein
MTKITASMRADMHARRLNGERVDNIASSYGLKPMAVYQQLRRNYGLDNYKNLPTPANDNVPGRVRKMAAHNGGCSTLRGMMPVTLAEVATIERAAVAMSQREQEMAVAA